MLNHNVIEPSSNKEIMYCDSIKIIFNYINFIKFYMYVKVNITYFSNRL